MRRTRTWWLTTVITCSAVLVPACASSDQPLSEKAAVTATTMADAPAIDEAAVRSHVAERVHELGGTVDAKDVTVSTLPGEAAPGIVAFVASYDTVDGRSSLSGIVDESGPNTYPLIAAGKVFDRWLTNGGLPAPARAAEVITFIVSNGSFQHALLTSDEVGKLPRPEWREKVGLPSTIQVDGQPGLEFWLSTQRGLVRKRVVAQKGGGVTIEDQLIGDVMKGK